MVMALDDEDKQTFRELLASYRESRAAVEGSADFGAKGGSGEQKHNNHRADSEAKAANLKHFLADKADEGVGDDELGEVGTLTPKQLADLKSELG